MVAIVVSSAVQTVLAGFTEKTELRDATGKVIGYFTPWKIAEDEMYAEVIKSFDLDEARRLEEFLASGEKGYTSEEVLKELEELEKSRCPSR